MKNQGFVLILVVLSFLVTPLSCRPCDPPEKPESLSNNVKWFGDCDGGNWIELIDIDNQNQIIRFKIYRDYDGILEMDANFKFNNSCSINKSDWSDKIAGYLNQKIELKNDQNCLLEPIFPAFGGEEWEIIKNKSN